MASRSNNGYQTFVGDFLTEDVWVVCPSCGEQAIVRTNPSADQKEAMDIAKAVCVRCGYNKRLSTRPRATLYTTNGKMVSGDYYVLGSPIDPLFHLPLWLQREFGRHVLWAYNPTHLAFLRDHIEAKLRERSGQDRYNRSLGSRLPRWMTSEKNRIALLKVVDELFARVG